MKLWNKDNSEIIRNYITAIGLFFGGIWAVYSFNKLNNAQINLLTEQKLKNDIESKLSLDISIETLQTNNLINGYRGLVIEVAVFIKV